VEASAPLVFVTVGTDHHPFDRVISWVDGWLANGGRDRARCIVQCGTSRPPSVADWIDYVRYEDLQSTVSEAAAVVSHGGPATIMDCRRHGLIPLVVPRKREFGEHVDNHQTRFAKRLDELGEIKLVLDRDTLWRALDAAVSDASTFRSTPGAIRIQDAVECFSRLMDTLVGGS
jgi:UDP-N-acetylglucosamine transferase subunit ALG13